MTNYAFFDVDQTIYPGYSMADFYLSPDILALGGENIYQQDLEIGALYKSGQITYGEAGLRAARLSASTVKGKSTKMVHTLADKFIQQKGLKQFVFPLFDYLHQHDYQIILVSGSVDFIVRSIANYCHADSYHATTLALSPDNIYTGAITHQIDNAEKALLIRQLYDLTRDRVLCFGDSTGDVPMLELADHAFIINPHQPEIHDLISAHNNWYLVNDDNVVSQVQSIISRQ